MVVGREVFHKCSTALLEGALRGDATSTKVAPALFDRSPAIQTPRRPIATRAEASDLQRSLSPRTLTLDATSLEQSPFAARTDLQGAAATEGRTIGGLQREGQLQPPQRSQACRRRGPRDRRLAAAENAQRGRNFCCCHPPRCVRPRPTALRVT